MVGSTAEHTSALGSSNAAEVTWIAAVEAVRAELAGRGYGVRIADLGPPDESDVRLQVRHPHSDREVELFGGCDVLVRRGRWFAACASEEDRSVWRGPGLGCPAAQAADFVQSLLHSGACSATDPYDRLG